MQDILLLNLFVYYRYRYHHKYNFFRLTKAENLIDASPIPDFMHALRLIACGFCNCNFIYKTYFL